MDTVQRDVAIPTHIFNLDPPTGYTAASTPENARAMPKQPNHFRLRPGRLNIHLLFALPDGSLIACWDREPDAKSDLQTPPWTDLRPGDDYPNQALQVHALKTLLKEEELVFEGYHLAHTQKEGKDYAWGLYVSMQEVAASRLTRQPFMVDHQNSGGGQMWLPINAAVESEADFGALVLQAIAEFSDEGGAPLLTLQQVLELASQKRME